MPNFDRINKRIRDFGHDRCGQVALVFALLLLPLLGGVGAAVDYTKANSVRSKLQSALDAAVLAGAADQTTTQTTTASNAFAANFRSYSGVTNSPPAFATDGDNFRGSVQATVPAAFMSMLGMSTITVATNSTAAPSSRSADGHTLCVFALNGTAQSAIGDSGGTSVNAPNCIVQVNSSNSKAVTLSGGATINSAENCFVGKTSTSGGSSFSPAPDVVCAAKADPFRSYTTPTFSGCDYTNFKTSVPATLQPGVYCGGISISSTNVTFAPGLYIINGGVLSSSGSSVVKGNGVSFYLTGSGAGISTSGGSAWHIVATSSGPLAGFVFFLDPNASAAQKSTLSGSSELYFEGVIYLPDQQLTLSGGSSAYTSSPFTAYIADTFVLSGSATLTILSDPSKTSVPVPSALLSGSGGQLLRLVY